MNIRDRILQSNDVVKEPVEVPEWGAGLFVRVMSGKQRAKLETLYAQNKLEDLRAFLVAYTLCDETGTRIFNDDDMERINEKNSLILDKIADAGGVLNGIKSRDVDTVGKS